VSSSRKQQSSEATPAQPQPTARLLITLFRAFEEDVVEKLIKHGWKDISLSHLNVLRHLPYKGAQIVEIAQAAGLTKQAIGKIVNELSKRGIVKLASHAEDGRAKLVTLTAKGEKLIQDSIEIIIEVERTYEKTLGKKTYTELRTSLETLQQLYLK